MHWLTDIPIGRPRAAYSNEEYRKGMVPKKGLRFYNEIRSFGPIGWYLFWGHKGPPLGERVKGARKLSKGEYGWYFTGETECMG